MQPCKLYCKCREIGNRHGLNVHARRSKKDQSETVESLHEAEVRIC